MSGIARLQSNQAGFSAQTAIWGYSEVCDKEHVMKLRLGLAAMALMMSVLSAALFVSEYRVFQFTQSLTSLQARAATDVLPTARSGWAQRKITQYCIKALTAQVFVVFPHALQRQGYFSCLDVAEKLLAFNPAHAEAFMIRAVAWTRLGAKPARVQDDLSASQRAAPQLTWLADRRLIFHLSQPHDLRWRTLIDGEVHILLHSYVGRERLAHLYVAWPEYREILQTSVAHHSEQIQSRFFKHVRRTLQDTN